MAAEDVKSNPWALDKRVPIAMLLGLVVQTGAILVLGTAWYTTVNFRLNVLEEAQKDDYKLEDKVSDFNLRLVKIESGIDATNKRLDRIGDTMRELLKVKDEP